MLSHSDPNRNESQIITVKLRKGVSSLSPRPSPQPCSSRTWASRAAIQSGNPSWRAYLTSQATPKCLSIDTKVDNLPARYAHVEAAFGDDSNFQSYIHDFKVHLHHGPKVDVFQIFVKRHVRLLPNAHIADVKGDLVVMRVSNQAGLGVVNARAGDSRLMDFVVEKPSSTNPLRKRPVTCLPICELPGNTNVTEGDIVSFVDNDFGGDGQELEPVTLPQYTSTPAFLSNIRDPLVQAFSSATSPTAVGYTTSTAPSCRSLSKGSRYVEASGDTSILDRALPLAERELEWWKTNRTISVTSPSTNKTYSLAQYNVRNTVLKPESYLDDYTTVHGVSPALNSSAQADLFAELASGADTGWDYPSRWLKDVSVGLPQHSERYRRQQPLDRSLAIKAGILDLCWNATKLAFYDFNLLTNAHNTVITAATYYPVLERDLPRRVLGICAIASRYSDDPRVLLEGEDQHSAGWKWVRQLQPEKIQGRILPDCTLLTSFLKLIGLHLGCTAQVDHCFIVGVGILISLGILISQGLGLHPEDFYTRLPGLEAEMYHRTFWSFLLWEGLIAAIKGRLSITTSIDWSLDLPSGLDDADWGKSSQELAHGPPALLNISESGTGALGDQAKGAFASTKVYNDLDIASIKSLPATENHRNVDLAVVAADAGGVRQHALSCLRCSSVSPWPAGRSGCAEHAEVCVDYYVSRVDWRERCCGDYGEGKNLMSFGEVNETVDMIDLLYDAIQAGTAARGREGYYFIVTDIFALEQLTEIVETRAGSASAVDANRVGPIHAWRDKSSRFLWRQWRCRFPSEKKMGWKPVLGKEELSQSNRDEVAQWKGN
ncbi:Fungal-trans domain-containing protein [Mycena chlorophos]|uniref:alpha,alpha-trehalase n=1 Tax=Mycena chlorophos TaxID=658473 RepID=A0A8H6TPC1_MYCCL|nr:Fungal-trans domain-containing protein [Mycena chlorophos]